MTIPNRCDAQHPIHEFVHCEEPAGHDGPHRCDARILTGGSDRFLRWDEKKRPLRKPDEP